MISNNALNETTNLTNAGIKNKTLKIAHNLVAIPKIAIKANLTKCSPITTRKTEEAQVRKGAMMEVTQSYNLPTVLPSRVIKPINLETICQIRKK